MLIWFILFGAILITPYLTDSPTLGDNLTRNTVRLALVSYGAAASVMLLLQPDEWTAVAGAGRAAGFNLAAHGRLLWTLAWAAYLVHVVMAFHHYHHWSHAEAIKHVQSESGFGEGIYFSYLFTLVWTADIIYWWLWPARYARRSPWIDRSLHGFMAFIIFNATVIFETGLIRWGGILLFVILATIGLTSRCSKLRRIPEHKEV